MKRGNYLTKIISPHKNNSREHSGKFIGPMNPQTPIRDELMDYGQYYTREQALTHLVGPFTATEMMYLVRPPNLWDLLVSWFKYG